MKDRFMFYFLQELYWLLYWSKQKKFKLTRRKQFYYIGKIFIKLALEDNMTDFDYIDKKNMIFSGE